jgi:hypothetical protein
LKLGQEGTVRLHRLHRGAGLLRLARCSLESLKAAKHVRVNGGYLLVGWLLLEHARHLSGTSAEYEGLEELRVPHVQLLLSHHLLQVHFKGRVLRLLRLGAGGLSDCDRALQGLSGLLRNFFAFLIGVVIVPVPLPMGRLGLAARTTIP